MFDMSNVKIIVYGRVQGVYYRAFAARTAKLLSITGWVRNTESGNVEAELEGECKSLDEMIKQLKTGPSGAVVKKIDQIWGNYSGQYRTFDVRY